MKSTHHLGEIQIQIQSLALIVFTALSSWGLDFFLIREIDFNDTQVFHSKGVLEGNNEWYRSEKCILRALYFPTQCPK